MFTQMYFQSVTHIISYFSHFVKSFFSGHKWTRTTDLTLIRRAL